MNGEETVGNSPCLIVREPADASIFLPFSFSKAWKADAACHYSLGLLNVAPLTSSFTIFGGPDGDDKTSLPGR
jgi:hypothetical protein